MRFFTPRAEKVFSPFTLRKLRIQLAVLNQAKVLSDVDVPGWRLHALKGDLNGFHAITVNANWRIIFRFIGTDVELVDYLDYH